MALAGGAGSRGKGRSVGCEWRKSEAEQYRMPIHIEQRLPQSNNIKPTIDMKHNAWAGVLVAGGRGFAV